MEKKWKLPDHMGLYRGFIGLRLFHFWSSSVSFAGKELIFPIGRMAKKMETIILYKYRVIQGFSYYSIFILREAKNQNIDAFPLVVALPHTRNRHTPTSDHSIHICAYIYIYIMRKIY